MAKAREQQIGVTEFKAKCLALVNAVSRGKVDRVVLTKRGKPVAELTPLTVRQRPYVSSRGALKHMINLRDDVDLTAPSDLEWDAEKGILFNE